MLTGKIKMIKLAKLANKLDSQGFYKDADKLDEIISDIVVFRKKINKLIPENRKIYQENNPNVIRLSNKLINTLQELDCSEAEEILYQIKTAGIGDFLSGIGEIIKYPFSSAGSFFRDLAQGGKLKKYIKNGIENLSEIRSLIQSGEEQNLLQAQKMIAEDINSLSVILKDAYGDRVFFDDQIDNPQSNVEQFSENNIEDTPEESQSNDRQTREIDNILNANSKNILIKKYAQNRGALALINDLAQLEFAVKNTENLKTAFNAWVKVLSVLNGIQYDRTPEPAYVSGNPDINDPSRGGGFDPRGGNERPKGKDLIEIFDRESGQMNTEAILKSISNKKTHLGAAKYLIRQFPTIYSDDQRGLESAWEDAQELRRIFNTKNPRFPEEGTSWNYKTK